MSQKNSLRKEVVTEERVLDPVPVASPAELYIVRGKDQKVRGVSITVETTKGEKIHELTVPFQAQPIAFAPEGLKPVNK